MLIFVLAMILEVTRVGQILPANADFCSCDDLEGLEVALMCQRWLILILAMILEVTRVGQVLPANAEYCPER